MFHPYAASLPRDPGSFSSETGTDWDAEGRMSEFSRHPDDVESSETPEEEDDDESDSDDDEDEDEREERERFRTAMSYVRNYLVSTVPKYLDMLFPPEPTDHMTADDIPRTVLESISHRWISVGQRRRPPVSAGNIADEDEMDARCTDAFRQCCRVSEVVSTLRRLSDTPAEAEFFWQLGVCVDHDRDLCLDRSTEGLFDLEPDDRVLAAQQILRLQEKFAGVTSRQYCTRSFADLATAIEEETGLDRAFYLQIRESFDTVRADWDHFCDEVWDELSQEVGDDPDAAVKVYIKWEQAVKSFPTRFPVWKATRVPRPPQSSVRPLEQPSAEEDEASAEEDEASAEENEASPDSVVEMCASGYSM